jgi:hypothetical protein
MLRKWICCCILAVLGLGGVLVAQVWKEKPIAQWTPEDAKQVLSGSPWVKTVTPTVDRSAAAPRATAGPGGIDIGGVGIGFPGRGRRGLNGRTSRTPGNGNGDAGDVPKLTLRWVSALPMIAAQVIAHEIDGPAISEDLYAISVYGLSGRLIGGDADRAAAELKRSAVLKREGKKDIKPTTVEVLMPEAGPVIVYIFPRSVEISREDANVDFEALIGRLKVTQPFIPAEMVYQGKL